MQIASTNYINSIDVTKQSITDNICLLIFRYIALNSSAYQQRVERNFLSLNVYGGAFEKSYLTDKPKIADMTFVANFGAALSLWASISAAVIIEVIEFFVRECFNGRGS